MKRMPADEVFEAISHPLRIKALKLLAAKPRSFSELKRELGVESSGKLDFHLKKMEGLVALDEEGKYTLTKEGYAALQAVETIKKHGWQRRAYFLNLAAFTLANIYSAVTHPSLWLTVILPATGAWIAFYSYWSIVKRKIFKAL
ncbi:MAG TPA: ArsR family transcriptional regulator [Candidatus Methanomethylia archaeon]|nr:ArsR family transcriptional regulator [Candidatus Methanomethylicia archaeon]